MKTAKAELRTFKKENGIKNPEEIKDKKIRKEHVKLQKAVDAASENLDAINEACKELKPASSAFAQKYTYPEGMDDKAERKKYRAKMRREAAQAAKAEAGEGEEVKEEKKTKKAKKEEKPVEQPKETKADKKAKKKAKKENKEVEEEEGEED